MSRILQVVEERRYKPPCDDHTFIFWHEITDIVLIKELKNRARYSNVKNIGRTFSATLINYKSLDLESLRISSRIPININSIEIKIQNFLIGLEISESIAKLLLELTK